MTTSAIVARCRPIVHAVFGLAFVVATSTARAADYEQPFATGWPRGLREVVTERSLLVIGGVRQAAAKGDPTATRILVGTAGTECTATAMLTYR